MGRALALFLIVGLAGAASAQGNPTRAPRPGTVVLKVMTFNIKGFTADWFSREKRIAALIREEQPDIVALQEVMGVRKTHSFQASGLVDGYHYAFQGARKYSFFGPWMGNAILARGKVRDGSRRQLTKGPDDPALNTLPRAVTHAEVEVRPGVWLHVYSTHLHHRGGAASEGVRVTQAREVLAFMANDRPGPLLLMGDMNAEPDSATLDTLRGGGLRDAWAEARPGDQTGTNQAGTRRIDYVLWQEPDARTPGVRILDAWTRGPNVNGATGAMISDHKAVVVLAEVRLPR